MGFYETWEHYDINGKKERFTGLGYAPGKQVLINGQLPKSHGISYYYARELIRRDLNEFSGFDLLIIHPEKTYQELVQETKDLT